jgi:hypothetical protein
VSLQQDSTSGARLALDVRLTGVENVAAMAFDLVFNPQVMNFAEFSEGDFFSQGGDVSTQVAENPEGRLIVGVALLGASEGVSGDGVAITLVFNAVSNGGSSFSFENAQLVDPDVDSGQGRRGSAVSTPPPPTAGAKNWPGRPAGASGPSRVPVSPNKRLFCSPGRLPIS